MPIITLLTDFGLTDSYVGETKAAILRLAPAATLVDITHEVAQGDVRSAAYLLGRTWHRFAAGTVHLAVVDPGVGTGRRALAVSAAGHYVVGPDNGVLTPLIDAHSRAVELPVPDEAAPTFHGRDVFAPAAARLANGEPLENLGDPAPDVRRVQLPAHEVRGGVLVGEVIYIDRFGTLITNVPGPELARASSVEVAGGQRAQVGRTFGDVEPGALVAFAGSAGTVEIAARNRSAAQLTGAGVGAEVRLLRD